MSDSHRRPIFHRATAQVSSAARRAWNSTNSAKAIKQIESALSHGNSLATGASTAIQYALRTWQKHANWTESSISRLAQSDFGGVLREVQRYTRQGGAAGKVIAEMLGTLGPLGKLIHLVAGTPRNSGRSELNRDIQSALQFLDAVEPGALSTPGRRSARSSMPATGSIAAQIEAAKEFLETQGYEVTAPAELAREAQRPLYPGGVSRETARGTDRKVVDLDVDGVKRRFPVTHPIVTGDYVQCQSSNVHSFAYQYDKSRLMVRYHPSAETGRGKGTLYAYENVPARKFLAMLDSPSKGAWLWDNVRIRGTVSGHQHDYTLVAVAGGYVPRKATYTLQGEAYVPRELEFTNVATGQRRTMRSQLPSSLVNQTTFTRPTGRR
jgi:hypothetical protein